ncbi:MAG: bifunctional phosphopantothenoylcysteine decarboxylase/phosphopantothenate--cysteine ligase CoaBC [Gammaproteobacteria bacterium]|nr:MAG: bifunctional phosphopantothenoylcysteine decarboxylase/phosphopantothenate--cysteine ligase CoaBC [Gammaproteobacteria bacterium]TDJ35054.1 MAG: bifunctional phosphopantothenoylcysteine decarboxylase/phosphopantothenate--cysteine ligase CoaBC [Gammaproteobacteria bacterium]
MTQLAGKRIVLGISGGIAAYKTPSLVRLMREAQAEVQVVMTPNAHRFVTATTLQAVAGNPVRDDLWDPQAEAAMGHIELARWAEVILIAPTTADTLSRLAQGRANDLLCSICLASHAPLLLAPAMNQVMWESAATRRNVKQLEDDGTRMLGPGTGDQACGEVGPGRMLEPEELLERLIDELASSGELKIEKKNVHERKPLKGRKVIVTAGPTREAIDPVRYISNHSSGRQGFAVAAAAVAQGAEVVLISGPVSIPVPGGLRCISVDSAEQMHAAVNAELPGCDIFIGVAAVADYRPAHVADLKIKKEAQRDQKLELSLVENPDIIASVAASAHKPFVVGFAAETHNVLEHAKGKRVRKGLDVIVVNDVSLADIGFNSIDNAATVVWADGELTLPKQNKSSLARSIVEQVTLLFSKQLANTNPRHAV